MKVQSKIQERAPLHFFLILSFFFFLQCGGNAWPEEIIQPKPPPQTVRSLASKSNCTPTTSTRGTIHLISSNEKWLNPQPLFFFFFFNLFTGQTTCEEIPSVMYQVIDQDIALTTFPSSHFGLLQLLTKLHGNATGRSTAWKVSITKVSDGTARAMGVC